MSVIMCLPNQRLYYKYFQETAEQSCLCFPLGLRPRRQQGSWGAPWAPGPAAAGALVLLLKHLLCVLSPWGSPGRVRGPIEARLTEVPQHSSQGEGGPCPPLDMNRAGQYQGFSIQPHCSSSGSAS